LTLARVLLIGGAALIAWATLLPQPGAPSTIEFCIFCDYLGGLDLALNILLFVPLGAGLRLLGMRARRVVVICLTTAVLIEIAQLWIPGRDTSLRDVLGNTTGAAVGALLASTWHLWLTPSSRVARRLLWSGVAVLLAMLTISAWLMRLSLPLATYWGQYAPALGNFAHFTGVVRDARLNGDSLESGRMADTRRVRSRLAQGIQLEARVLVGAPTERLAPIASIFDGRRREVVLLGQDGEDLVFRVRQRAVDLRLRRIGVRLPGFFAGLRSGDSALVAGGLEAGVLWVRGERAGVARSALTELDPALGWATVMPFDYPLPPTEARAGAFVWLLLLTLPLGWWFAATRSESSLASWLPLPASAIAAAAFPIVLGVGPHVMNAFAALVGAALGWGLALVKGRGSRAEQTRGGHARTEAPSQQRA
jgi:VanZ family protein